MAKGLATVSAQARYLVGERVSYLVPLSETDCLLDAIVIAIEQNNGFCYSIKLNGGFVVSPVPEQYLLVNQNP